jgi:hypothetical protein
VKLENADEKMPVDVEDSFDWKPNTTYLMCSTMKHILPPSKVSAQFDPETPQNLTFLVLPAKDTLNGMFPSVSSLLFSFLIL